MRNEWSWRGTRDKNERCGDATRQRVSHRCMAACCCKASTKGSLVSSGCARIVRPHARSRRRTAALLAMLGPACWG